MDLSNGDARVEALDEAQLVGEDVAHPGQVALVEQCLPDRSIEIGPQPSLGLVGIPVRTEQVRAQVAGAVARQGGRVDDDDLAALIAGKDTWTVS